MKTKSFLSLLTVLIFISCSKNESAKLKLKPTMELTTETFNCVGEQHNLWLDEIYENTIRQGKTLSYKNIVSDVTHYLKNVNENTKYSKDDLTFLNTSSTKSYIKYLAKEPSFLSIISNCNDLTTNQIQYIKQLNEIVINSNDTWSIIVSKIKVIENAAIRNFSETEIVYCLCLSSTAKSSLKYWNSNLGKKWFDYYGKPFIPIGELNISNFKIDWHNVAVADIAGFGAGFPKGVTVGMVAGGLAAGAASGGTAAGIGAILGGLAGGTVSGVATAAVASAGALAAEIVADWFGW